MEKAKKGFTLLELLIVIAIIVLLGIILIFALNPAETLAKSRDAQRISDLSTLKTAIAVYTTTVSGTPDLDTGVTDHCLDLPGTNTDALISYSSNDGDTACLTNVAEGSDVPMGTNFGGTGGAGDSCRYANAATATDGTGWLPVNLNSITGGSPVSALPLDPTNTVGTPATPVTADLVYRYACQHATGTATEPEYVFELNATLESTTYAVTDNLDANDGGDNAGLYEVGTSVRLMGTGADF